MKAFPTPAGRHAAALQHLVGAVGHVPLLGQVQAGGNQGLGMSARRREAPKAALALETGELSQQGKRDGLAS